MPLSDWTVLDNGASVFYDHFIVSDESHEIR